MNTLIIIKKQIAIVDTTQSYEICTDAPHIHILHCEISVPFKDDFDLESFYDCIENTVAINDPWNLVELVQGLYTGLSTEWEINTIKGRIEGVDVTVEVKQ